MCSLSGIFNFTITDCSSAVEESGLEGVDVLHQLLIHLDLLDRDLPSISQIVPHLVLLVVHDRLLQRSDHLSLSLDQLGLLFHSL